MGDQPGRIYLTADERRQLKAIINDPTVLKSVAKRAKILLLRTEGKSMRTIAAELGTHYNVVLYWVKRFNKRPKDCNMRELLSVAKGRGPKRQFTDSDIEWLKEENRKRTETGEGISAFAARINREAKDAGHARLSTAARCTIAYLLK